MPELQVPHAEAATLSCVHSKGNLLKIMLSCRERGILLEFFQAVSAPISLPGLAELLQPDVHLSDLVQLLKKL